MLEEKIEYNEKNEHSFCRSFEIIRKPKGKRNEDKNVIAIEEKTDNKIISRHHAGVILRNKIGFFLYDKGSSNGTFIKLQEKIPIVLQVGFKFKMGTSIFNVLSIESDKITLNCRLFQSDITQTIEIEGINDNEDIYFGKKIKEKKGINFIDDKSIENENLIFNRKKGKNMMTPLISTKG